jgi:hypothetical protein
MAHYSVWWFGAPDRVHSLKTQSNRIHSMFDASDTYRVGPTLPFSDIGGVPR